MEVYLARKYGLTGSLPALHPWKNSTTGPFDQTASLGGQDATVTFYWGDDNASNVANNWDYNHPLSTAQSVGVAMHQLSGLTKGTTYYYTAYISNSGGNAWADVKSFVPALTQLGKDSIPDLALWLDATDVNGDGNPDSLSSGSSVSSWGNKANGTRTVSATGTSRPTYQMNSFGSKPGIRFDGLNDGFNLSAIRASTGGYSLYIVSARPTTGTGDPDAYLFEEAGWNLMAGFGNPAYTVKISKKSASAGSTLSNLKL